MNLGLKIKTLRLKYHWTQEELAEKLSVTPQAISKWENDVTMPDISLLPQLSEVFGTTIDDLFDLSVEQKFNRIENKLDITEELSHEDFMDIEQYLKEQEKIETYKYQATYLLAYLYTHRLMSDAKRASLYARKAIKMNPAKKECQWMLGKAENDYCWDWDMNNHTKVINFYKEVVEENKDTYLPYYFLIDNLIADHRVDEASQYLEKFSQLKPDAIAMIASYKANIELAKYNEKAADEIMDKLIKEYPDDEYVNFEMAQYYVKKGHFKEAINYFEKSFETSKRSPRFIDELLSIADIYNILGDIKQEIATYDRIIKCLKEEWQLVDEVELKNMEQKRDALLKQL